MSNNTYLALTIGPITESLLSARKTRELWGASYLFSYIMRKTVKALSLEGLDVILPSIDHVDEPNYFGAGLYPDRIIVRASLNGKSHDIMNQVFKDVIKECADQISATKGLNKFSIEDVEKYINSYFTASIVAFTVEPEENIIYKASEWLDSAELKSRIRTREEPALSEEDPQWANFTPYRLFLHQVNGSFLYQDGFKKTAPDSETRKLVSQRPSYGFDSLIEIATRELKMEDPVWWENEIEPAFASSETKSVKEEDDEQEEIMYKLKARFGDKFKQYHRYVAIVHADGDNIGEVIKLKQNASDIRDFSNRMLKFASWATREIVENGGAPIYMGGDDMLFISPVSFQSKSIFELIRKLDAQFNKEFASDISEIRDKVSNGAITPKIPSLSFGIMISYYKHPLYEAKSKSYELLDFIKKNVPGKNAINVTLRKHSGQNISFLLQKGVPNTAVFNGAADLVDRTIRNPDFLNSFTYKLSTQEVILHHIARDRKRLEYFFHNNFDENWNANKDFFDSLSDLIHTLYSVRGRFSIEESRLVYGILRTIHFIRSIKD